MFYFGYGTLNSVTSPKYLSLDVHLFVTILLSYNTKRHDCAQTRHNGIGIAALTTKQLFILK